MAKKFDFLSPGIEIREIDQSFIPQERDAEGPIIIGRTRKGPANKPVKIRNLDDYVSVFGLPIPGGAGPQGDVWRDGNTAGPTYASYAAQAWLASENSPITVVRLAGDEHPSKTDNGKAGWDLSGSLDSTHADNSTAYGLFLVASSSANNDKTGSLAAVFYMREGSLALSGTLADDSSDVEQAGALIKSSGDNSEFKLVVSGSGVAKKTYDFNFSRNSTKYIRTVLNTNPQLTNEATTPTAQTENYWLGESFTREVRDLNLHDADAGTVYGILLPLQNDDDVNWSDHREGAKEAGTGWVVSQQEKNQVDLFRLKSLHVGEDIQKDYMVAIEQITAPANASVNPFGSFTVAIKNLSGQTIERYVGVNFNPSSPDYIAKRIGDQYLDWDNTNRRYRTYGDFQNQSNIVYVELKRFIKEGGGQGFLPAGFKGPVRPKGFSLTSGSANTKAFNDSTSDFTGSFVKGNADMPNSGGSVAQFAHLLNDFTASFNFPSLALRANGTEGGAPDPYRAYYGIRPKISDSSNQNDNDYVDYLRRLPGALSNTVASGDLEHSFIFSLDDLVVTTGSNSVVYTVDSYDDNASYTAVSGTFADLLNLNVRQFLMPLHGGFEGFDITEKEPLRDGLISSTRDDRGDYIHFTLNKAIDSVLDPEVVPANLILMPGIRKPVITDRIIAAAESRKDVLALIDLEGDYKPQAEWIDTDDNESTLGSVSTAVTNIKQRGLNSSYAAAFYPWVQVADNLNGGNLVWVPPSVAGLGALGRSQAQSDVWFAPAGFNRGGLGSLGGSRGPKVLQARQRLDSKERDLLYEVNINPIATFPAEGVVIFGQKTLQADASALDRINVRRLVLYLKSRVSAISRNLLFDQNVESTWNRFKAQVNPVLSDTKARFGLSDYKLILDDTTTTADLVDRNIMYAKIYIKPARSIEYIVVDFVITRTGADFV